MSVSRFKFVSPGISLKEIDKSKTPTESTAVGPVVVGRAVRGPGMRPVKVQSYADFVEVFGEPNPGAASGDIWREGGSQAPTYGAYAAKAYLNNNAPLTFVRLLGFQNDQATSEGYAGWKLAGTASATAASSNGGAYGLFVIPITSNGNADLWTAGNTTTGSLAAIFYVNQGTIGLVGPNLSGAQGTFDVAGSASVLVRSTTIGSKEFRIKIADGTGAEVTTTTFNFDASSKSFIRSVFNTNPTLLNSRINSTTKNYFLGETFEQFVSDTVNAPATSGSYAAVLLALESGSVYGGRFTKNAEVSSTGWIVGQHQGANSSFTQDATTGEYPVQKLFKLHSLTEGEWNQNNIKISISDIKPSPSRFEKYGTFTVTVRRMSDDDQSTQPIEVFTGLNLNPASPNYIAKRIGDSYSEWDYSLKSYTEKGVYPNLSKFIRVEMDLAVDAGSSDLAELLPFGFYGPQKFKTVAGVIGNGATGTASLAAFTPGFVNSKSFNAPGLATASFGIVSNSPFSASFAFPELATVNTASTVADIQSDSTANALEKTYFGIKTKQGSTKLFNPEVKDVIRTKAYNVPNALLTYSFLFSLDDVQYSGSSTAVATVQTGNVAFWVEGSRATGKSVTAKTANTLDSANFQKIARFTVPLVGGFDGFNITEKEPFSEASTGPISSTSNETTSYAYNSIQVALDAVSDPEVVEMNLLSVPGIQNSKLTNRVIELCEQRADALGIIDLEGDFKSIHEGNQSVAQGEVKPVVATAVTNLKARTVNNSYGCAFFPAVLAKDTSADALVSLPASVVALGVMGSSAAASDVWFAPAGFTRGGLSSGAAGFPVVGVKKKLTSSERDSLYEVNINPIASFPAEGIVVFGQKTLQATPSSLDRINVRRLMIYLKKEISRFAATLLFDPNTEVTWARFTGQVVPFLQDVKARFGLTDFKVVLDSTTTTPELVDRNILYAKIFLKPARAIEFIALDFILTNTGASFDD
jgi:phage tail sheath protein FI